MTNCKMDAEATVKAKEAFERIASEHGTTVKHYHADNGLFDTKAFKQSVRVSAQTLSFVGSTVTTKMELPNVESAM